MNAATRARVRRRTRNKCEYCKLHQTDSPLAALHVEHIIPKAPGGNDSLENLALACIDCNLHKGTNLSGIDLGTVVYCHYFHGHNLDSELFHGAYRDTLDLLLLHRNRCCGPRGRPHLLR